MVKVLVEETNLTNIANSIREKTGTTDTYKPSEMAEAISNISSGGGSAITKGIVINAVDDAGYATDVSILGMTEIPDYYLYYAGYKSSSYLGWLGKVGNNLHLPDEIEKIGRYALAYNTDLGKIKLPKNLKELDIYVFINDTLLEIDELPSSLTTLGSGCFSGCSKLAINKLPVGITNIEASAFIYCSGITEIVCEGDIKTINTQVFRGCSKLAKFVMGNITSVPTLNNSNAFQSTAIANGTGYIYVPDNLIDSFKTATNWSTYADQIKGVSEL